MSDQAGVRSTAIHFELPTWRPLVALLGQVRADEFMWMARLDLSDGYAVHAYKHVGSRRYFYLSTSGRPYRFNGHSYEVISEAENLRTLLEVAGEDPTSVGRT